MHVIKVVLIGAYVARIGQAYRLGLDDASTALYLLSALSLAIVGYAGSKARAL